MPNDAPYAAGGGSELGIVSSVAHVLGRGGEVVGAGFLIGENTLFTCAHVVRAAGQAPGGRVRLAFPRVEGAPRVEGYVLDEPWRAPDAEDVAVVRLDDTPAGVRALPLGSSAGCRGHRVRSFGFPVQAPPGGHFGFGVAGDVLPHADGTGPLLQLTDANDLTVGFSGGPVVDEVTGLVIGMLTAITAPDDHGRGLGIAYATPTRTLREIWPGLTERDVTPYRGLEPFTAEHARWFKGREGAVGQVLAALAGQQRVLLLLGPSGSGKSSLIQAGVLPALSEGALPGSDRWLPVVARPRQDLLAELERAGLLWAGTHGIAAAVDRLLASEHERHRVVLAIDQFEELLTDAAADGNGLRDRRLAAVDQLMKAITSHAALSVILIMRDDFYPLLAALAPQLLEAATPGLLNVPGILSSHELHAMVALPAQDAGARFQHGLPEQIITDILATAPEGTAARGAPVTVLPLLELTLSQLWQRRHDDDGDLTHDAYRRIGGISGSLASWCDAALNQLRPEQRAIAQRILTALVRPADDTHHIPAVRRHVSLQELRDLADAPQTPGGDQAVSEILAALTHHRIITTHTSRTPGQPDNAPGRPMAELTHDALIRDWGVLRQWVTQDHQFQDWLQRAREQHARWSGHSDPGDLLTGTALAEGLDWARQRSLPRDIADYLHVSRQRQQATIRRSRRLNGIMATVLVLALTAAGVAFWQRQKAIAEGRTALSRQLAAQSGALVDSDPDLASLLAVEAFRTSPTAEAVASLDIASALPFRRRLNGHAGPVHAVAFSPDGRTLATGNDDGRVRLWDVATGRPRATLTGHTGLVKAVAFSPDGRILATGGNDGPVRLWDTATGRTRATIGRAGFVDSLAFSPDGGSLATGGDGGTARLWDVATGRSRATLVSHADLVESVAFSPDGRTIATGTDDGTVRLWGAATHRIQATFSGHTNIVDSVAFSPDGRTLATGSMEGTARLWDVATHRTLAVLSAHTAIVDSVAFSPDGRTLATGSDDGAVRLWDVAAGRIRATLTGHTGPVDSVEFSPDGRALATGSDDGTVRLWDMAVNRTRVTLNHTGPMGLSAFSPDGRVLATGSDDDNPIRLWKAATGRKDRALTGHADVVDSVAFSPDGRTLATGSDDGTVRLWDLATGRSRTTVAGPSDPLSTGTGTGTEAVVSVRFSPDGRALATGSLDGTVRVWDVATGRSRAVLSHADAVRSVAFSPDGHMLATGGDDGIVRLWDVATGRTRTSFSRTSQVFSVAFSPDGRTLATGSYDETVRLWDVTTGRTRVTLTGRNGPVEAVGFSPDGRTLATGSLNGTVSLWDVTTHRTRATLTGQNDIVNSVAFSPDGRTLAAGSFDDTVRLWDVTLTDPAAIIKTICQAVDRDFTAEERSVYLPGRSTGLACPS